MTKKKESAASSSEVAVFNKDGAEVRRYSEAVHGEDFKALAEEFATKNSYKVGKPKGAPADEAEAAPADEE